MSSYVMSEQMFSNLSNVHGFNNINGNTYQEHIVMCLDLSGLVKKQFLKAVTGK